MAGQAAGPDPLHRAGQSVGERLQRELQRQTERRVLERRDLLHTARGNGTRRAVEAAVQYRPTPSCPRRTTPRPRDDKTIALVPQEAPTPGTTDGSGSTIGSGTATGGTSEARPYALGPVRPDRDRAHGQGDFPSAGARSGCRACSPRPECTRPRDRQPSSTFPAYPRVEPPLTALPLQEDFLFEDERDGLEIPESEGFFVFDASFQFLNDLVRSTAECGPEPRLSCTDRSPVGIMPPGPMRTPQRAPLHLRDSLPIVGPTIEPCACRWGRIRRRPHAYPSGGNTWPMRRRRPAEDSPSR